MHSVFFEFLRALLRNSLHTRKSWSRKFDEGFLPKLLVAASMTKSGAACMRVLGAAIGMPDKRTVARMAERLRPKTDAPPYGFLQANLAQFLDYCTLPGPAKPRPRPRPCALLTRQPPTPPLWPRRCVVFDASIRT